MKPSLSIIMPCYNCKDTLREAVESCFAQGLQSFEIVMVDDCSTDGTREIMSELRDEHPELKLFYHEINKGGGAARNTAVERAESDTIFCLDGDDILPPNVLSKMLSCMNEKKCDGVLFEETRFFSGNDTLKTESVKNTIFNRSVIFEDIFRDNVGFLAKVNFLYTKNSHHIAGGYPAHHGFDTQGFGHRFLSRGLKVYVCPGTYYLHRRHAKPSYFDREYKKGNLSINTYLMYEDFLFLFSDKVKEKILRFNIQKNRKLNKHSLDQMVASEYRKNKDGLFIRDYSKYLAPGGEESYIEENRLSSEPMQLFTRAVYTERQKGAREALPLYQSLQKIYPSSKVLDLKLNKKIVLLMHNGGRLGNQLWLMAAFYAYCFERGYKFDVRCFFEYQEYFNIKIESFFARLFGKLYFLLGEMGIPENILRDAAYGIFTTWSDIFRIIKNKNVISDSEDSNEKTFKIFVYKRYKAIVRVALNTFYKVFGISKEEPYAYATTHTPTLLFLPPSTDRDPIHFADSYTYFTGWLFRNPDGIVKYQKELTQFFTPKEFVNKKVASYIHGLKKSYKHVIGVHVRLGDVVNEFMNNDRIAYSEPEVYTILKQYLVFSNKKAEETCFVICSDGKISKSSFEGLNIEITHNSAVEDLWLLSKTDTIIGADSSFAIMASLLGDKTFIVFKRGIEWDYYKDKKGFFVNKYVERFIY